jgi:hypothetical protein
VSRDHWVPEHGQLRWRVEYHSDWLSINPTVAYRNEHSHLVERNKFGKSLLRKWRELVFDLRHKLAANGENFRRLEQTKPQDASEVSSTIG